MFSLTKTAAEQIIASAEQSGMERLSLRIAAKKLANGTFEYGMGFDDATEEDLVLRCNGVEVIMAPEFEPLLNSTTVDFVTLDTGEQSFVFVNPLDANYDPNAGGPGEGGGCGCGSGGCH